MHVKASELNGRALDWAVQKAIGWHFNIAGEGRAYGAGLPELIKQARALVANRIGETVDVPDELVKQ